MTTVGRPRQATWTDRWRTVAVAALLLPALALPLVTAPSAAAAGPSAAAAAASPASVTFTSAGAFPPCPSGRYVVPDGIRFVEVTATGGAGTGGASYTDSNTGGPGGTGAKLVATVPVTPGQSLTVVAGRDGSNVNSDAYSGWPNGGENSFHRGSGGGASYVTTQPLVASTGCKDIATSRLDRTKMLVVAGGGGGGGSASNFGSGGYAGNAGVGGSLGGENGRDAYHLDSDCGQGRAGSGASTTAPGAGGVATCLSNAPGASGQGFDGGGYLDTTINPYAGPGAGGGGWYGGGGGSGGNGLGGGGGGGGSSYVTPTTRTYAVSQASAGPSVVITPLPTPTSAATAGGSSLVDWYTALPTIALSADAAGGAAVSTTYYALDDPACTAAATSSCRVYTGPFTVGAGLHTLTAFTVNSLGLDGAVLTRSFAVTPTTAGTNAAVTASGLGSGTNPSASAGGPAGTPGTISVTSSGTGAVGAAVYAANPAGATTFASSGAFVDVIAAGSGLQRLTIVNCTLNGGTTVSWWNGSAWELVSNQTYDPATRCVTVTVNAATRPSVSQLTGTFLAAGSPPTTTAVATIAGGAPYTAGTWTNRAVTVAFTCSPTATLAGPATVTLPQQGQGQSASATCTDGIGQHTTTTFTDVDIDTTPPSCSVVVSPTVIWSPRDKPTAVAGSITAGDDLSGVAQVVGGAVTSTVGLRVGDVQGFKVAATYPGPLLSSTVVDLGGTLNSKHAESTRGRTYTQVVAVTDQAGNSATCSWTVTVPRNQPRPPAR